MSDVLERGVDPHLINATKLALAAAQRAVAEAIPRIVQEAVGQAVERVQAPLELKIVKHLRDEIARLPTPADPRSKIEDEVRSIWMRNRDILIADVVRLIPKPKDGEDGDDGDDADPLLIERMVAEAVGKLSFPNPLDIQRMIADAIDKLSFAAPLDVQHMIEDAIDKLSFAAPLDVQRMIVEAIDKLSFPSLSDIERTVSNEIGKFSFATSLDVQRMIAEASDRMIAVAVNSLPDVGKMVGEAVEKLPKPKDGKDGVLTEALPYRLDKTYQRGQLTTFGGGTWQARCETIDSPPEANSRDWELIADGICANECVFEGDRLKLAFASGKTLTSEPLRGLKGDNAIEITLHGAYNPTKRYPRLAIVALNNDSWISKCETDAPPGESADWQLLSKQGNRGKKGDPGDRGAKPESSEILRMVQEEVAKIPRPRDGHDINPLVVETTIESMVKKEVANLPPPKLLKGDPGEPGKNAHDGVIVFSSTDPTLEDIPPGQWRVWLNSNVESLWLYANVGGVLRKAKFE